MTNSNRKSEFVTENGVEIETYIDVDGPALFILPSYGRDGAEDFDIFTAQIVRAGWKVLRPQPRGIAGSKGPMTDVTLHDLGNDVALCIRTMSDSPSVLLGHAFGHAVARIVATDHPALVRGVILAASQASKVPEYVAKAPFIAGDPSASEIDRLEVLRMAFFAPNHDPNIWLDGWYPKTLKMQHSAAQAVTLSEYWACGDASLIWRLDFGTNDVKPSISVWLEHESMGYFPGKMKPEQPGVNGVRYAAESNYLYYTATAKKLFMRVKVDPRSLAPASQPELVVAGRMGDDFFIDERSGVIYLTTHRQNTIDVVSMEPALNSGFTQSVAGDPYTDQMIGLSGGA